VSGARSVTRRGRSPEQVGSKAPPPILFPVTALQVIRQLEKLPPRERRKVFAHVDRELEKKEELADRKAVAEVRSDTHPAVPWEDVKVRLGLL